MARESGCPMHLEFPTSKLWYQEIQPNPRHLPSSFSFTWCASQTVTRENNLPAAEVDLDSSRGCEPPYAGDRSRNLRNLRSHARVRPSGKCWVPLSDAPASGVAGFADRGVELRYGATVKLRILLPRRPVGERAGLGFRAKRLQSAMGVGI
jgi:hypothetical protein